MENCGRFVKWYIHTEYIDMAVFSSDDISLHGLHGFVSDEKLYFKEGNKKRLRWQI